MDSFALIMIGFGVLFVAYMIWFVVSMINIHNS